MKWFLYAFGVLVLASMLSITFVNSGCKLSKSNSTRHMIMSLEMALEQYNADFGCNPPGPAIGSADDGTLLKCLNGTDISNALDNDRRRHCVYLMLSSRFQKEENGRTIIVDDWGMPIHYLNSKAFVERGGNPRYCHNPKGVDLFSTGPDKLKDLGNIEPGTWEVLPKEKVHLVDDITNF